MLHTSWGRSYHLIQVKVQKQAFGSHSETDRGAILLITSHCTINILLRPVFYGIISTPSEEERILFVSKMAKMCTTPQIQALSHSNPDLKLIYYWRLLHVEIDSNLTGTAFLTFTALVKAHRPIAHVVNHSGILSSIVVARHMSDSQRKLTVTAYNGCITLL